MSDRPTAEERIADPLSHFPYRHAAARRAVTSEAEEAIVDATAVYVAAQEAWLREPSAESKAAHREAADIVVTTRQAHRAEREREWLRALLELAEAGTPLKASEAALLRELAGRYGAELPAEIAVDDEAAPAADPEA